MFVNDQSLLYTRRVAKYWKEHTLMRNKHIMPFTLFHHVHKSLKTKGKTSQVWSRSWKIKPQCYDWSELLSVGETNRLSFKMQSSLSVRWLWAKGAAECLKGFHRETFSRPAEASRKCFWSLVTLHLSLWTHSLDVIVLRLSNNGIT